MPKLVNWEEKSELVRYVRITTNYYLFQFPPNSNSLTSVLTNAKKTEFCTASLQRPVTWE
jgi:hypothetical protein